MSYICEIIVFYLVFKNIYEIKMETNVFHSNFSFLLLLDPNQELKINGATITVPLNPSPFYSIILEKEIRANSCDFVPVFKKRGISTFFGCFSLCGSGLSLACWSFWAEAERVERAPTTPETIL